jgi:hypothetical protein
MVFGYRAVRHMARQPAGPAVTASR